MSVSPGLLQERRVRVLINELITDDRSSWSGRPLAAADRYKLERSLASIAALKSQLDAAHDTIQGLKMKCDQQEIIITGLIRYFV